MKKRGVLSLWKVIILVIVGFIGIAGVTVLSLYLMGSFDDELIEPENISFVEDISDGSAYYNSTLEQFEASSDFNMTITTSTENVTERSVTLSLVGQELLSNGYITDGVITVPQVVTLNRAFTVELNREYNSSTQILEDWIIGGNSVLTATSSNVLILPETVKISVDVPVHPTNGIDVQVSGSSQTGETQEVVVGTTFTLDTIFHPSQSKYLFSDETREKEIFYAFTSSYISYDWEEERFVADLRSGNNMDTISVYTFSNSYYQKQVMDMYSSITDRELLTSNVTRYLDSHPEARIMKTINIKVLDIDVDSVEIGSSETSLSFSTYLDQYFTLTAASANGDGSLNLSIKDSSGASLNSLFGNVGIKFPKNATGLSLLGGRVMEVVTTDNGTIITQKDFDQSFDYASAPAGTEYYILPNNSPRDYVDYYWQFASSTEKEYDFAVNFFFENEDGNWESFFAFSGDTNIEKTMTLTVEDHDYEEEPSWQTNDTIFMTINFDEEGNSISSNIDLSKELNPVNQENVYKTVKYFLLIDTNEVGYAENLNMQEAFLCGSGMVYTEDYKGQTLAIAGTQTPNNGYTLYEIDGSVLTAVKSFSGKVKVIAATIKTDANNNPYLAEDGKYMIVKTSRVKDIMVESTLSITNLEPTISFATEILPNVEYNNDYYIPAINRNETGSQKTMITFELVLTNSEDPETDSQKVITAFNSGNLNIVCLDLNGQSANDYVTLQGLVEEGVAGNEITFEGTLAIEEAYFSANRSSVDRGTYIRLQLQYDNGRETYSKDITIQDSEKNYFYIYYQQPVSITAEYENQFDLDNDGDGVLDDVVVNISATSGISITWGNRPINGTTDTVIAELNELLAITYTDQFGNTIDPNSGIYNMRLVETPEQGNYILSFDSSLSKIQNFISTQGVERTTNLTAYVVDNEGNFVYAFDETGNVTQDMLQTQTLTFRVQSEGVKLLEYDPTDIVGPIADDVYKSSTSLSQATASKYVTSNQTIDMNTLLRVYTSGADEELTMANNLVYKLDDGFISSLSSSNKIDIMKMIKFNNTETLEDGETDNIENYRDTNISVLNIVNPFKEDTQIVFSVRDENESLFDITLVLILKSDITINQSLNSYYEENSDYLVTNGNAISVFAGETYDLAEYFTISSHLGENYSWVNSLGALDLNSNINGVFYSTQDFCYLTPVQQNGEIVRILLTIDDIYQFREVRFTIYFGTNSFYASSVTMTLYVNPNIVVRQTVSDLSSNPYINLETISSQQLSNNYKLYKLTSYIEEGGFDGAEEIVSDLNTGATAFAYNNISAEKYLNIEQVTGGTNSYNFYFVDDSELSINLGQRVEQRYQISVSSVGSSTTQILDAVKIVENGTERQIVLCERSGDLTISFDIGYGEDDNERLASNILKRDAGNNDTEDVDIVIYNQNIYLLLIPSSTYISQNNFSISSATGSLYSNSGRTLSTYGIDGFVSFAGNSFEAQKELVDASENSMHVNISLNAIVSKIGDKFVYYNNNDLPDTVEDMKFNSLSDQDFSVLIGDYATLEQKDVYQTLQAGKTYTIVHDSSDDLISTEDAFGFYFDGILTQINDSYASYDISILPNAQGYIDGLATLKTEGDNSLATQLEINHLESAETDAYIVLRLELYQYTGNVRYVWYYRIKVAPNFTKGTVKYPYSDAGEYINTDSAYYDETTESYSINLEEEFTAQNSKYSSGKRFGDIAEWIGYEENETKPTVQANYTLKDAKVGEVSVSNFTYSFNDGYFNIKLSDNSSPLTITIEKSFSVDGVKMIGSEMQYIFYFNQGEQYVHSLRQSANGEESSLTAQKNTYSATINAGSEEVVFKPEIRISSNGTESRVNNFSAYIAGENLESALMTKILIKAGTVTYTDATGGTVKETLEEDLAIGEWQETAVDYSANPEEIVTLTDLDGTQYFVNKNDVNWTYAYLDENKELHLKPQTTIDQDRQFEIGFYTEERVVFKVDLTVTSYFEWEINPQITFEGGEKYTIQSGNNAIFSQLEVNEILASLTIYDFDLELLDESEPYRYIQTKDTELQPEKTYYVYDADMQTYLIVESPVVEDIGEYYEVELTYGDLVFIDNDAANYQENSVEFAHLLEDITFTFNGTISDSEGHQYSFTFDLNVESSFVIEQTRRYDDITNRYGSVDFDVSIDTIQDAMPDLMPLYDDVTGTKSAYMFVVTGADGTIQHSDLETIEPVNVASSTLQEQTFDVAYMFDNKEIFNFTVRYRFTVRPNVTVSPNYPIPDGETYSEKEYIATTQGADEVFKSELLEKFFVSVAPLARENRIVVENVEDLKSETLEKTWSVSVASISNATVEATGSIPTKTISASSEDMTIVTNVEESVIESLNLQFAIVNSSSNGLVTFDVTVNSVTTTYSVEIVPGSNIKISTNTPNYVNNRESVYAEDLAGQSSSHLFEQNRILSYAFNTNVISGTTYYLRFENSNREVQIFTITADTINQIINQDLGRGYLGYGYVGTYNSRGGAESDAGKIDDSTIYLAANYPRLTNRIVAYYYDDTPILFDDTNSLILNRTVDGVTTGVDANEFELTNKDYNEIVNLRVELKVGGETIETSGTYNLYLDIEFDVAGNADSSQNYTTVEVNAGVERSLFSYTSFGIRNPRTGLLYDATSMYNTTGTFTLQIYGFVDTIHIDTGTSDLGDDATEEQKLARVAGEIHNNLTSTTGKDLSTEIVYKTGLSPRAGFDVNKASSSGDLKNNYITISGVLNNGKTVDYDIFAQGANNDGNYVMMMVTYQVQIGDDYITESHNILFKVVANSTMRFKSQQESAQNYISGATEIVDGQTVMSNSISPYEIYLTNIGDSEINFNLWETTGLTDANASTILANMYGSSTNSANTFKYTYKDGLREGYNDRSELIAGSLIGWDHVGTSYSYNSDFGTPTVTELQIGIDTISLGSRSFIIELENVFGYKAYFYFRITANVNPTIYSMSEYTLTEGDTIGVGLRFQTVSTSTTADGKVMFNSFNYVIPDDPTDYTKNKIHINLYGSGYSITGAQIQATINNNNGGETLPYGSIITKTFDINVSAGSSEGLTLDIITPGPEGSNIGDWQDTNWIKDDGVQANLTGAALTDATCVLSLRVVREDTATGRIGYYRVRYGHSESPDYDDYEYLTQVYGISSTYQEPVYTGTGVTAPNININLTGIGAYGFSNSWGAVNVDSLTSTYITQQPISSMQNIHVKKIEFYLGETWLGGTYVDSSDETQTTLERADMENATEIDLVTNPDYSFVTGVTPSAAAVSQGISFSDDKAFKVPVISGIYFGTSSSISNVKMNITLSSGEEECVISEYITLKRSAGSDTLFEEEIYDTQTPKLASISGSREIYNDTLEIVLDPGESITFAINDAEITSIENNILTEVGGTTKTANLITRSNSSTYTITEYVGISGNIEGLEKNFERYDSFYLYVVSTSGEPQISYNGSELTVTDQKATGSIGAYNTGSSALVMNIESVGELLSNNTKSERLFFLFKENGQVYQYFQEFTIKPLYESATASGGNYFSVADYYKVTNKTNTYYVIPLKSWGRSIMLRGYNDSDTGTPLNGQEAYKFYFKINTASGGSGSAFIDENGLITTTEDFDIVAHTITVNVYMKVSGANGAFEEVSERVQLGSFRIYLSASGTEGTSSIGEGVWLDTPRGTDTVNNIMVVPTGYTVSTIGNTANLCNFTKLDLSGSTVDAGTFAIETGQTIDFTEVCSDPYNFGTTYHLVKYEVGESSTYVNFNNINSWTFTSAGSYTLTLVALGRDSNTGSVDSKIITLKVIVYETSTKEEQQYAGSTGEKFEDAFDSEYTWYLLKENGSIEEVSSFIPEGIGIYTNTYIAQPTISGGETKLVTKTFYVYDGTENMSVAIRPLATFQLSNLVTSLGSDQTVEFYKQELNQIVKKSSDSFTYGENSSAVAQYFVVIKNADGSYSSIEQYTVTYKFISSNVTNGSILIAKSDEAISDKIKEYASQSLGVDQTNIGRIEIMSSQGIVTEENRKGSDIGSDWILQEYVVTYRNNQGATRYARFSFNIYLYQAEVSVEMTTTINNAFRLSELNSDIQTAIQSETGKTVTVLGYYQHNETGISVIETIVLEETTTRAFYVRTNDGYYLVNVTFNI